MIRKAIIVVLMLCAGGTVYLRYGGLREWDIYHSCPSAVTVDTLPGRLRLTSKRHPPDASDRPSFSSSQILSADRGPFYFQNQTKSQDSWFHWPSHYSGRYSSGEYYNGVIVPLWMPLLLFSVYPIIALIRGSLRRRRRRRRRKRGLCTSCGYNLTCLPEPRCPECGTAFEAEG